MNVVSGFEWDLERKGGRRGSARGSKPFALIGQGLRDIYRDVLDQGTPEHLTGLVKRLEQRERAGRDSGEG